MLQSLIEARKWLVAAAVLVIAVVGISYYAAKLKVKPSLHNIPKELGIDIQQTSDGFSLSKSEGGRTLYTIRASKAVQFKAGGHADLQKVHVVVYGHQHDRYDQIYGEHFSYDPQSGDIVGTGEVHIDIQGYAEGPLKPDQSPPDELKNPVHLLTHNLTFNQKTGIAQTSEVVNFQSSQATGTATGAYYDSNSNELQLKSDVHIVTTGDKAAVITGASGVIQKLPRQAVLLDARIEQPAHTLTADKITMLFEPDNTVQHVVAEGNVHIESRGPTVVDVYGPHGDMNMGPNNSIQQTILTGGARFVTRGNNLTHGSADTFILDFDDQNQPARFHMVTNARLHQDPHPGKPGVGPASGQPMDIVADALDFQLANGSDLQTADTIGKAQIVILPNPTKSAGTAKSADKNAQDTSNSTTVATAGHFHATFGDGNQMQSLHGAPDSRIVSTSPDQPEKVSTADKLDVAFDSDGGVQKLVQTGNFEYHEPPAKPDTGGRAAFADKATYTPVDTLLVLTGAPRVIDGGMTTTANLVRMNRQSGDAWAEGDVKTTYSELKPQPDGALLASSDPIHVTAEHMASRQQPSIAHYTGNVRLWQGANVVRAPKIDFDQDTRTMIAFGDQHQRVLSLFIQESSDGKQTPTEVASDKLTYIDAERKARYTGNVLAKSAANSVSAQQIDVFLKEAGGQDSSSTKDASSTKRSTPILPGAEGPSKIDHMVATGNVIVTEPNRRAVGDQLIYTADDSKYYLTGKSPSIYDATHGTVWGDSLTFYNRDDRVTVESKRSSSTVTRARITK
jgi:lipopolysaccharide export system protein LptA